MSGLIAWMGLEGRLSPAQMRADALAGLTGAIVVLPQGLAFATIAGMPPQYGLYASIVPTIVAALFGSSWHLVAGPSTTASLILFASLTEFEHVGTARYVELALTLSAMAGLLELTLGLARLGALVNFISHTVVVGYTAGVGVLIMTTQIPSLLGANIHRAPGFVGAAKVAATALGEAALAPSLVAAATLAAGIATRLWWRKVPYMIPAVLVGAAAGAVANAWAPGSVSIVGPLPAKLPPLSAPSLDPAVWAMLLPTALAIAISALNEVVSISRALAIRSGQHLDVNKEFVAQGLANLTGSLFSSYVVSGSFNRSALNYDSGARTQFSALFGALILAAVLVFAAPLAAYLPHATMAASLELVGWSLIDRNSLARIWDAGRAERGVLLATVGAALFVHIQVAILAGVGLSLLVYLYRTSRPEFRARAPARDGARKFVDATEPASECPQVRYFRMDGSLYFGAVNAFRDALRGWARQSPGCKRFAIIMRGVNFIDFAGAEALSTEARRLREAGGALYLVNVKESPMQYLKDRGRIAEIGADKVFASK
ncbi:MAG: SulP family inorganic anion transporter, partial [Pseudomonadota bacterium]|nr:SulP family inorganic anion transporter [Pseudomonadota bacterium]